MRVLLIQTPSWITDKVCVLPNIGLAYIAAVLEKAGIDVGVYDAIAEGVLPNNLDKIIDRVREFRPDIIGAGGQTPSSVFSLNIFRRTKKEISPEIITVAGGPHFTFTDRETLEKNTQLDFVVRGEGEETFKELCHRILGGEDLTGLKGITFRNEKGEIVRNPDREPITDLDSLPYPAWHLFPVEKYHWLGNRMLSIASSRGCPFRCPHCAAWKIHSSYRKRDPEKVVQEMVWAKRTYGSDTFYFNEDMSFVSHKDMENYLDALERSGEKLYWQFSTREETLYDFKDMWWRMKKNGLFKVVIGIESPDPEFRKKIGKRPLDCSTVERMMYTLEHELDILVVIYLLWGMPGDTEKQFIAIQKYGLYLLPKFCSFVIGSLISPFPGTELFDQLKEKNLITTYDWEEYGPSKYIIKTSLSDERIQELLSGFWKGLYARPKVMWQQVKNYCSKNHFRRTQAKNYVATTIEMIRRQKEQY